MTKTTLKSTNHKFTVHFVPDDGPDAGTLHVFGSKNGPGSLRLNIRAALELQYVLACYLSGREPEESDCGEAGTAEGCRTCSACKEIRP